MCGVVGRFNYRTGAPVDPRSLERMCDLIAHRGPDAAGVWTDGPVGFGHRRLAIIDLSPAGRQPMATEDEAVRITFNGEIYNFRELRQLLAGRGHRFRTRTDTEVILAAWREYGQECVHHLRGMYAFAIWDAGSRVLFLARDRVGKKPLFFWDGPDGLAFASEPKAFLADPSFVARPDPLALSLYLSYQYVPSPLSAFQGVRKLSPGCTLTVQDGRATVDRYWTLRYGHKRKETERELREALIEKLCDAVRLRLVSDVPLGAFLSGGIDSGTIVALMTRVGGERVKTFSIGFDEKEFDELAWARLVARHYDTEHHEFIVRPSAIDVLPRLVWHYNEPFADPSAIPTYLLAKLARQHVTVALNGDAGDENFGGYTRYVTRPEVALYERLPLQGRRAVSRLVSLLPEPGNPGHWLARRKRWLDLHAEPFERRYAREMMHFQPAFKARLCRPEFLAAAGGGDPSDLLAHACRQSGASDALDAAMAMDVAHYLPDALLVKVDIATMAHGLEGRSPLLDQEVMAFAASLPSNLKVRGRETKYILRRIAQDLLPPEILVRPKMGFGVPLDRWFRHELREMTRDTLLSTRMKERGYFQTDVVERLIADHETGRFPRGNQLWNLLCFELWHRMFVDERPAAAPVSAVA